jgi:hypothetical protein
LPSLFFFIHHVCVYQMNNQTENLNLFKVLDFYIWCDP